MEMFASFHRNPYYSVKYHEKEMKLEESSDIQHA